MGKLYNLRGKQRILTAINSSFNASAEIPLLSATNEEQTERSESNLVSTTIPVNALLVNNVLVEENLQQLVCSTWSRVNKRFPVDKSNTHTFEALAKAKDAGLKGEMESEEYVY